MSFSKNIYEFLAIEMCIDVEDLLDKISSIDSKINQKNVFYLIPKYYFALSTISPRTEIKRICLEHDFLFKQPEVYALIDPIQHAFDCFAAGGLHQLYTRQENETWYPRIILNREIQPNDITSLDDPIIVFRGCSVQEYNTKKYGQSWSTSIEIAELFAYTHYNSQPWFDLESRRILKAEVSRSAVFYSKQAGEFEVILDPDKLSKVECVDA